MITFSLNYKFNYADFDGFTMPTNAIAKEYLGDIIVRKAEQAQGIRRKKGNPKYDDSELNDMRSVLQNPQHINGYSHVLAKYDSPVKKDELRILTMNEIEEGQRGVSEVVLAFIEEHLDDVIESSEFTWALREFFVMRDYCMDEEGVDIAIVLLKALEGVVPAIARLKKLVTDFCLDEIIQVLCSQPNLSSKILAFVG